MTGPVREKRHGTYGEYRKHGCRCGLCRKANAEYMRGYRSGSARDEVLLRQQARTRAMERLRRFRPVDFAAFYADELRKVGLSPSETPRR
jgi:hypothetical protein